MPTYDYKCENCGNTFEFFQSIKDEPLTLCPECGHEKLKKMVSVPAGLIFKGSGFYLTDYVKKNSSSTDPVSKPKDTKPVSSETQKPAAKEKKPESKKKNK